MCPNVAYVRNVLVVRANCHSVTCVTWVSLYIWLYNWQMLLIRWLWNVG